MYMSLQTITLCSHFCGCVLNLNCWRRAAVTRFSQAAWSKTPASGSVYQPELLMRHGWNFNLEVSPPLKVTHWAVESLLTRPEICRPDWTSAAKKWTAVVLQFFRCCYSLIKNAEMKNLLRSVLSAEFLLFFSPLSVGSNTVPIGSQYNDSGMISHSVASTSQDAELPGRKLFWRNVWNLCCDWKSIM